MVVVEVQVSAKTPQESDRFAEVPAVVPALEVLLWGSWSLVLVVEVDVPLQARDPLVLDRPLVQEEPPW